ncbi:hypothetical protein VP01_111g10 [Puccinia sorghi]|uniref:Uncharacterized protein n=1 Tax=Puccinia sorghi TaxID=27349 RepID=A0A0L6VSD3_9BASI|nr:hypothetical protein VP01_111g10 [Puccinia sorghi]
MAVSVTINSEEGRKMTKVEEHSSLPKHTIGLNETINTIRTSIFCQCVSYQLLNLYSTVPLNDNINPTHCPTLEEVTSACHTVDSTLCLLNSGRCVITSKILQVNHCCDRVHSLGEVDHKGQGRLELLIHFSPWFKRVYQSGGFVKFINLVALSNRSWGVLVVHNL